MDFQFDINARRIRATSPALLKDLRAFAATVNNRPFTVQEYQDWPKRRFNSGTIIPRFGTWRAALREIGIQTSRVRHYTPEELIAKLEHVWRQIHRPPGNMKLWQLARVTPVPYNRHWGSIHKACERLALHHAGKLSRKQLLAGVNKSHRRDRGALSLRTRWEILQRDRFRCQACGQSPATNPNLELEVDHIKPLARGGTHKPTNLQTLCKPCNRGKAAKLNPATNAKRKLSARRAR